ncbi:MAG TPA: OsmC family protein [Gemmatimonadaceae bacterium]|nr:OsmC family protein [Gemmatimonadaceae bacterium]
MKITLTGEESLTLESSSGPLTIEAQSHDQSYSPFHMLGSALGGCTLSVLQSWAANRNIPANDLKIDVGWAFVAGQHRVSSMSVKLDWPSLSAEMWPRAIRVASVCGIHQTLTHPIEISVDAVGAESPEIEAPAHLEKSESLSSTSSRADDQPRSTNRP